MAREKPQMGESGTHFHVLLGVGKTLSLIGWLGVIAGVIAVIAALLPSLGVTEGSTRIGLAIVGVLGAVFSFAIVAFGQLLEVFVVIEHNTRNTHEAVAAMGLRMQGSTADRPFNP
ncbi:MAG: hypothetical protein ACYDDF_11155 [Thermoplasmatota archaeon]